MEIKTKHQVLAALGLMAVAAAVLWPPEAYSGRSVTYRWTDNPFRRAGERVTLRIAEVSNALYIARRVESALAALDGRNATDGPIVVTSPDIPDGLAEYVETQMNDHWRALGSPTEMPVIIDISSDVGPPREDEPFRNRAKAGRFRVVPVVDTPNPACVYLITVGHRQLDASRNRPRYARRTFRPHAPELGLSTCAFYAAYGVPGRGPDQWLTATAGRLASLGFRESTEAPSVVDPGGYRSVYWRHPPDVLACMSGRVDGCLSATLRGIEPDRYRNTSLPTLGPGIQIDHDSYRSSFDEATPYFLADVLRQYGPERFRGLWTSDAPFEIAFERATQVSLGMHTRGWVAGNLPRVHTTASFPPGEITILLLVAAVSVGGAAWVAQRRRV